MITPIATYEQLRSHYPWYRRVRSPLRDAAVWALSRRRRTPHASEWIRFPYYHHVFDDERGGFAQQLDWMRNHADFLSLDCAVSLLASGDPLDGRYFCLSFDDGLKNGFTNAFPVLAEKQVPAAFFLPVQFVGASLEDAHAAMDRFTGIPWISPDVIQFLSWDESRALAGSGMAIGSHGSTEANLAELDDREVAREMQDSKRKIEQELGSPCLHFSCPARHSGRQFVPERDPRIARETGYRSFLTSCRGAMHRGESPYLIRRDHLLAQWGHYQLRYFLGG